MKGDAMADGMCGGHVAKERLALFLQNNCLPKGHCGDCRAHGLRRPVSPRVRVCTLCVGVCGLSCGCVHTDHRSAGCTVGLFSGAGRPSHSAPTHQTRTTERCRHHALTPNKASRDTSLSLLSMPTTQTLAAQVSTPELSSEHGAFLLNCSNRCSFAHPASYFLHSITLFTFFSK